MRKLYLIGSLRNPRVLDVASTLRAYTEWEIFDDWYAAGPTADDSWKEYELQKERDYEDALNGYAARHVFGFDKHHLDTSDAAILVCPAGKSAHLELGYSIGLGKPSAILLDDADIRWDVMYQFADFITDDPGELSQWLNSL